MKALYRPISILCAALLLFSGFRSPQGSSGESFSIKKGIISFGNTKVTPDWDLATCRNALTGESRFRDGFNNTYTYDNKGVVLFEKKSDGTATGIVSEIQLYFSIPAETYQIMPTTTCSMPVTVDKLKVTRWLSPKKMRSALKKWEKTDSYIAHSYRMASKGIYIYFQFNDAETELIKISAGPDKRAK